MRSSYCGTNACVDVDNVTFHNKIVVSDKDGNEVFFTYEEWRAFILGVKNNEFDI